MKRLFLIGLFTLVASVGLAAIPPAPTKHFTDNANVVSKEVVETLDAKLTTLENTDSTQFYVVIYPKLEQGSSLEDFTQKAAQSWKIGQKGKNNGLVLFFFADDGTGHKLVRYEIGYGLEGRFTDGGSKLLMEKGIIPNLKTNNWNAAVNAGVNGAIGQIKGEYKATKSTSTHSGWYYFGIIFFIVWVICLILIPRITWSITGDLLNIVFAIACGGKSDSGSSGGGGSFGGGGSSGRS